MKSNAYTVATLGASAALEGAPPRRRHQKVVSFLRHLRDPQVLELAAVVEGAMRTSDGNAAAIRRALIWFVEAQP